MHCLFVILKRIKITHTKSGIFISLFLISNCLQAQKVHLSAEHLTASKVFLSYEKIEGEKALKVLVDTTIQAFDEPMIVNDLKLGEHHAGAIGLWVGNWMEGYFRDLKVTQQ